jgi:hypothetical protein
MVKVPGVVPLAGLTVSQLPELPLVVAAAVNGSAPELEAICTVWVAGAVPPA